MSGDGRPLAHELRRADERARQLAQRCFERPLVLEAGAGTGKTAALVARVLAWSFGPGWARAAAAETTAEKRAELGAAEPGSDDRIATRVLRGVVAITFTERAAAEMSDRIGGALLCVEHGERPSWLCADVLSPDPLESRRRARALRGALDHLTVQTIHAFCRRLLAEHALDAELHPQLEVDADGRAQADAARAAIEVWLQTAYADRGDPDLATLGARGMGPRELERALLALLDAGLPAAALEAEVASPGRVAALVARFRGELEAVVEMAAGLRERQDLAGATVARLDEMLAVLARRPPSDRAGLTAWIGWLDESFASSERKRLADWGRGRFLKGEREALAERCTPLAARVRRLSPVLDHVLAIDLELLDAARRTLRPLLIAVETQLRSAGVATFPALLAHTRRLLIDRPDVAARIRAGIDQLLVDEFQDTDRTQCDIVRELALRGAEADRPGLFAVGDPKQSIYGWRSADLAAYAEFVAEVSAAGGQLERLSVNYRSVPRVLAAVESILEPAMIEEPGLQPRFEPLIASLGNAGEGGFERGGRAPVEHWVPVACGSDPPGPRPTRALEASELEATALAADVRELHDRHRVAWSSIGVLFRSRGDWEIYLSALRALGVPHAVEGDRNYYRRREIIEAASLLCCVLDPDDPVATLSYLRSAAVGVPDAAWIPLWLRRLPEKLRALREPDRDALAELAGLVRSAAGAVPAETPGIERICGWEENLLAALVQIGRLRASFAVDPADVFVENLRTGSGLEVTEASRRSGAWRCANLERFFGEIGDWLGEGRGVHELLHRLRTAVADEEAREESRPADRALDAVQVMTIHGAKGLDFDHVYLMQLHKGRGGLGVAAAGAASRDAFEYELLGAPSLGWDRVMSARARVVEAERVRLLYVAMTRARQRLVLSGLWPEHQIRSAAGQAIELIRPGGASSQEREWLATAAEKGDAERFDASGARWFWPALARVSERPSSPDVRTELPDEREMVASSRRLAALRRRASRRMERPFAETASSRARGARALPGRERPAPARQAARSIGTAIHRCLETFDFSAEPAAEFERQRIALGRSLVAPSEPAGLEIAERLLARIEGGALFARLRSLADHILARELPVLIPPFGAAGPVGYSTGTIDLLYRDPQRDEIVVADYKTDAFGDSSDLQARADGYYGQGAVYQRAIREALDLDYAPRFELWFLEADRILEPRGSEASEMARVTSDHL